MVLCLMIMRIRQWPELQMRKIKQKFILTRQRLPKENCLVFLRFAAISRVFSLLWPVCGKFI